MSELAAYVGWDWADQKHQICVKVAGQAGMEQREIDADPSSIHGWANQMLEQFGGAPIGVCIENSRGRVIWALMDYPHIELYPVNPKAAKSYRSAFYPSGKKDDPVDAEMLMKMLAGHQDDLRRFVPADVETRKISLINEGRRTFVGESVSLTNRLRETLKGCFPLVLDMVGELDTLMACAFLLRWPTFDKLRRAHEKTLHEFYSSHRSRSAEKIDARIELWRKAVTLTNDEAIVEVGHLAVTTMVPVILALLEAIAKIDIELDQAYQSHAEFELIDSFPGAGRVMGPRLLAILGSDRSRFESASELQCMTAAAPVTIESGTSRLVQRRYRRSKFVHQTVVEWAGHSLRSSLWARTFYDSQRAKGKSHWVALRALAFKWLRILFRCWQTRTLYDEKTYIDSLIRSGSPLVSAINSADA